MERESVHIAGDGWGSKINTGSSLEAQEGRAAGP